MSGGWQPKPSDTSLGRPPFTPVNKDALRAMWVETWYKALEADWQDPTEVADKFLEDYRDRFL